MCSVRRGIPAAERARWLAELSQALTEAHQLLTGMDLPPERAIEARELYLRIEAARLEVQSLRLSRSLNAREQNGPRRTDFAPWEERTAREA